MTDAKVINGLCAAADEWMKRVEETDGFAVSEDLLVAVMAHRAAGSPVVPEIEVTQTAGDAQCTFTLQERLVEATDNAIRAEERLRELRTWIIEEIDEALPNLKLSDYDLEHARIIYRNVLWAMDHLDEWIQARGENRVHRQAPAAPVDVPSAEALLEAAECLEGCEDGYCCGAEAQRPWLETALLLRRLAGGNQEVEGYHAMNNYRELGLEEEILALAKVKP